MAELVPGVSVRRATRDDLEAIVDIYNSTIASRMVTADLTPVSVTAREPWFAAHGERHPLWVAEAGRRLVGWASLSAFHSRAAYDATAEVSVYLAPDTRGRGLGAAFLRFVEAACPALGVRNLVALVFGHNAPSVALFSRAGYARWGELPQVAELDGVRRDLLMLGKHLTQD